MDSDLRTRLVGGRNLLVRVYFNEMVFFIFTLERCLSVYINCDMTKGNDQFLFDNFCILVDFD